MHLNVYKVMLTYPPFISKMQLLRNGLASSRMRQSLKLIHQRIVRFKHANKNINSIYSDMFLYLAYYVHVVVSMFKTCLLWKY